MNKKLIIFLISLVILILLGYQLFKAKSTNPGENQGGKDSVVETDEKRANLLSTSPDLTNETIVAAEQVIEISFDKPLENSGELKMRIEPKPEYKVELSGDRKVAKIIPTKPYELGLGYTIFISPESKFDNGARLKDGREFHFRTVKYRGFN